MGMREFLNLSYPDIPKQLDDKKLNAQFINAYDDFIKLRTALLGCRDEYAKSLKSIKDMYDTTYQMMSFTESDPKKSKALEELNKAFGALMRGYKQL